MDAVAQLTAALTGRYTIDREIGRGGMATVYLARDVKHNRRVALKVLNAELGAVLGVERFLAEIEVTANLQHPNLLPLFDSGEAAGLLFYVMPFVEGESLRALLQREKQLPIEDAVRIAGAVASALDYAHRHGVIHRDLKPENILMHDGQPLIADFGIALAVSNAGGNRITQTGLSLGTPHYMSPEQATGDREIDGRTDVYSLGAVTYEMLVGEPPHDGKTSQAIIAKVLTDKPRSIRLARDTVPPYIETAVERSLAKLPADRFHTAHEFADAIQGRGAAAASLTTPIAAESVRRSASGTSSRLRAALPWTVAVLALAAAAVAVRGARRGSGDAGVVRYEIPLAATTFSIAGGNQVAISRDGRLVAYVSRSADGSRRIALRAADELQARDLPGTESATWPFFAPDGASLGFYAHGQIMKLSIGSGKLEVVAESPGIRGASWSPGGWIIASDNSVLVKTPAVGGTAQPFTKLNREKGETGQYTPVVLADGKHVLYTSAAMGGATAFKIGIASLDDGSTTILDLVGTFPLGVIDGYLVYTTAAGSLRAAPFDLAARRITGPSLALADEAAADGSFGFSYANMAADGSLVYVGGGGRRQLVLIDAKGTSHSIGEPGAFSWPRFAPDGNRFAVSVGPLAQRDVYLYQLPSGPMTRFTNQGDINDRPEWTADGRTVLFRSNRSGRDAIWSQPVDAAQGASLLFARREAQIDEGVLSPDGAFLLVQRDSTGSGELWYRSMQGDTTFRRIASGDGAYGGRFSPDGKWVVYTSTESGQEQVYVRPFPRIDNQYQVSTAGGGTPLWSADGKHIYYTLAGQLIEATIGSTQPFTIASRRVVLARGFTFYAVHADFDIAKDGSILALQAPNQDARLIVVRNFATELRARTQATPK